MLLHQRIDFNPQDGAKVYLRVPMSSTLWTVLEQRGGARSMEFPSRIVQPDKDNSVVFTGVDTSGLLLLDGVRGEYRVLWRIAADTADLSPNEHLTLVPLDRPVTFTFSHGNSSLLSLALGGVDIMLNFNVAARVLSTSWFTPPLTAYWSLAFLARMIGGGHAAQPRRLGTTPQSGGSWWNFLACRRWRGSGEDDKID